MRISTDEPEEIKLNMTAMIDIVFQLLIFFIVTFKVVAMEGDFSIKMPLASTNPEMSTKVFPDIISIKLNTTEDGEIGTIVVDNDTVLSSENRFPELTNIVETRIAAGGNPEQAAETEVEFVIAYGLKYKHTIAAIGAVSGRKIPDGSIKKLIEQITLKEGSKIE